MAWGSQWRKKGQEPRAEQGACCLEEMQDEGEMVHHSVPVPSPQINTERLGCAHVLMGRINEQRKKRAVILLLSTVAGLREVSQHDVSGRKYGRMER